MKEKIKRLVLKILLPIIIIIIAFSVTHYLKKYLQDKEKSPVVISDQIVKAQNFEKEPLQIVQRWESENIVGLNSILGINSEDEVIVGIGLSKDDYLKKYFNVKFNEMNNEEYKKAMEEIKGNVYKLNIKTLQKNLLAEINAYNEVLDDNREVDYSQNSNSVVCHIESGTLIRYISERGYNWAQDGSYLIDKSNKLNEKFNKKESNENRIYYYNIKSDTEKELLIDKSKIEVNFNSIYSEDGKKFYFIGNPKGDKSVNGIYKIDVEKGKFEEILVVPSIALKNIGYERSILSNYKVIDSGRKIILTASINGESGIYLYDAEVKKFFKVVSPVKRKNTVENDASLTTSNKGNKTKTGYMSYFWVSPDESRIAYINKTDEDGDKWELCVSRINEYGLSNKIILKKDILIPNTYETAVQWSKDSKKMYFISCKDGEYINGNAVSNDSHINIVTFK